MLAVRQRNSHKIHIKDQIVKYDRSQRVLRWVAESVNAWSLTPSFPRLFMAKWFMHRVKFTCFFFK
jgi:hypothetical protein